MKPKPVKTVRATIEPRTKPDRLLLWFAGFMLLVLPFILLPNTVDYTLMPRFLFLGIFLLIFGLVFLLYKKHSLPVTGLFRYTLFLVIGLFILSGILSMFFAFDFREGLYDLLKSMVLLWITFIGASLFIRNACWQETMAITAAISVLISALVGLIQYYLFVIEARSDLLPDGRILIYAVEGAMSHKNLFSVYFILMLPWLLHGSIIFKGPRRILSILATLAAFFMILLIQTRAVWVGILVATFLTATFALFFSNRLLISARVKKLIIVTLVLLFSSVAVIFIAGFRGSTNPYVQRVYSIAQPTSFQNVNRIKSWKLTLEMIRDHPITGVGPGNWQIISPRYFSGKFSGVEEINWIRPHNDFLWIMAERGLIGFIPFLLIFGLTIRYIWLIVRDGSPVNRKLAVAILWGMIAYLISSMFDFPYERPFHTAAMGLWLAAAVSMFYQIKPQKEIGMPSLGLSAIFAVTMVFSILFAFSTVRQEMFVRKCLDDSAVSDWNSMLVNALEASGGIRNLDSWGNPISSYTGKAHEGLGNLEMAEKYFEIAYSQCPTKLKVLTNLARVYQSNGKFPEAEEKLDEGLKIIPFHGKLMRQKVDLYFASGQFLKAKETYLQVENWQKDTVIVKNMKILDYEINRMKGQEGRVAGQ